MHPNWRALSTLHIPLKRFVTQGSTSVESSSTLYKEKYRVNNINASEVKEFYEGVISSPETTSKSAPVEEPCILNNHPRKVPFDKNKFFKAAMRNDVETLRLFSYLNDDINSTDTYGWTALMMAACEGAADAVEVLIGLGASTDFKDKSGNTACSLAEKKQFYNIIEMILKTKDKPTETDNHDEEEDQNIVQTEFFCDVCTRKFQETSLRDHVTSTVHQFNLKRDKVKNRFSIPFKNRGLKIMLKQGWDKESGLGPTNDGRLFPVKTVIRKPRTGLGTQQEPARVTHFGAYDLRAIKYVARPKTKNRNDMRREKQRDWKREHYLRRKMSKTDEQKIVEIIFSTEEVADTILVNKQELVELDKRRQSTREAIREIEKNCAHEKKVWTTIGSMLVKVPRETALKLLKNDQVTIETEINKLRSDQKILVNKHRDLEHMLPYSGTNLKALDRKEFAALKANLPFL